MEKKIDEKTKNTQRKVFVGIAVVVVIALVAGLVYWLTRAEPPEPEPTNGGRGIVATPDNMDELRAMVEQPVEDGYYETRMNVDWVFPSSSEPSENAFVENSINNSRTVYFDLKLAGTEEVIYSSPFIPVGATLEGFTLDARIPAGEYEGIVTYHLVDDDYQELTTVSVSVTLRILG
jgi:hypothetical protein